MIRILNFIAHLPGIRYLLALSASRRQDAITLLDPEKISLCSEIAECHKTMALQKNRIERLEQLARDLDAKLTEAEVIIFNSKIMNRR
jgi:hypothetical protein